MSKLPEKLWPHVHPDVGVDATTLVSEKPIKKMDRIAEIVNYGKLSVNSAQRIRIDTLQCSAVCTYSTHRGAQVYMYIIIQKVKVDGCHIFIRLRL